MAVQRGKVQSAQVQDLSGSPVSVALLDWYDRHRRELPWRAGPGEPSEAYRVWLSEIMLQQTTTTAVKSYYAAFLARWPTVADLAATPLEAVLQAWAGLGYYSRARNLHACARAVMERHGGRFPDSEEGLRGLPGIGPYTAAAIAAIAFDRRAVVVDGNVERVMARLFAIEQPLPDARPTVWRAMDGVTPPVRTGDFAQAVMDLGATICVPRTPACMLCPLTTWCAALKTAEPAAFPRKRARKAVPIRRGAAFYVERSDGAVLVRSRPPQGLFGGMTELPGTDWTLGDPAEPVTPPAGVSGPITHVGMVEHGLTHFTLILQVFRAQAASDLPADWRWVPAAGLDAEAFPTLMRKVVAKAQSGSEISPRPESAQQTPRSRRRRTN